MRNKLINHLSTNYGNYLMIFAVWIIILLGAFRTKAQTPQDVYNLCVQLEIKHPEIVVKQSILESGWYKCENCSRDKNNLFGFRYKHKYLEFQSWERSVVYYRFWQKSRYKGGNYFSFLDRIGYATSKTYIQKLKQIQLK